MKAGVAMAFTALELLAEAELLRREIVLLLVSDEEVGSPVSRPITEAIAKTCDAVYVLEPALWTRLQNGAQRHGQLAD